MSRTKSHHDDDAKSRKEEVIINNLASAKWARSTSDEPGIAITFKKWGAMEWGYKDIRDILIGGYKSDEEKKKNLAKLHRYDNHFQLGIKGDENLRIIAEWAEADPKRLAMAIKLADLDIPSPHSDLSSAVTPELTPQQPNSDSLAALVNSAIPGAVQPEPSGARHAHIETALPADVFAERFKTRVKRGKQRIQDFIGPSSQQTLFSSEETPDSTHSRLDKEDFGRDRY